MHNATIAHKRRLRCVVSGASLQSKNHVSMHYVSTNLPNQARCKSGIKAMHEALHGWNGETVMSMMEPIYQMLGTWFHTSPCWLHIHSFSCVGMLHDQFSIPIPQTLKNRVQQQYATR